MQMSQVLAAKFASFTHGDWAIYLWNSRFFLIVCVLVVHRITAQVYNSMILCFLFNLPGTFLHELCHYVVGLVLGSRPVNFTVIPQRTDGGYTLGSVSHSHTRWYNAIPSSMAPLLLLFLGYLFDKRVMAIGVSPSLYNLLMYGLIQALIIDAALPSSQDFKVAFSYPVGLAFYGSILMGLLVFFF